ncbi:MAG: Na(+)-translocating NADH-quinone reductase subunit A [Planctomycetes bacterium]|nr:Na(+)-translocating NADH-quinone reductase subunit A [Planctomycetota bacterium]
MSVHRISKGLDLPISGEPRQEISLKAVGRVAFIAADAVGLRPRLLVAEGDAVRRGQPILEDKKMPGVVYTAPGAGTVRAIHRGERRALQSVVIDLSDGERSGDLPAAEHQELSSFTGADPLSLGRDAVRDLLVESGLWTALRTRPFSRVPDPESRPHSIFVTATDSNPLAALPHAAIRGEESALQAGLICVSRLTEGKTYLCRHPGSAIEPPAAAAECGIQVEEFAGVHPAGTVGLHIHLLDPVSRRKTVWHLGYQDVVAIGKLFTTGRLDVRRVVSLAGPVVKSPRLLATRIGASLDDLVRGELEDVESRVISGSVLSGRAAMGEVHGYLGRYHLQVSALREGRDRELLSWLRLGAEKFSTIRAYLSGFLAPRKLAFTTSTNGSKRAIVPIGMYERVMPLDIQPVFLLKSLVMEDIARAEELGCLELDEEDLALCTFVCPGKIDYAPLLRNNLDLIEKEG